jgi:hypothetical protein
VSHFSVGHLWELNGKCVLVRQEVGLVRVIEFGIWRPNESALSQTSKIGQNSQIVNLIPKSGGDLLREMISHLAEGIFRPSGRIQSRDQQAHWQHGTSG